MILDGEFLTTQNYILRTLTLEDLAGNYRNWLNDQETVAFNSHGRFPQSIHSLENYVKNEMQNKSSLVLAVVSKESNEHIGNISLQQINWIDRNAEIAFLLGNKSYRGKGVMFEVGQKLIEHGFKALNLHRIHCGTASNNIGMQKLALKLGMRQEGVRIDAIFNDGKYYNIIEYGIIHSL